MQKITALCPAGERRKKVNLFLDTEFAFSLQAEFADKEGLQVGQELTEDRIEALIKADQFHRGLETAFRFLSNRPRSESELTDKLSKRGFDSSIQQTVITRLKELGLVDDIAFALFWKTNREQFSPRSKRLTRLELRRKGIDDDIIDGTIDNIDDENSAYKAALSKTRSLLSLDYQSYRRRLGGYLRRRGFSYEVINHTVERLWQEQVGSP